MANALTVIPFIFPQWFDATGKNPAAGHLLFFYAAGTSTKQAIYTDSSASVAASNPLVLNSAGRPDSLVFLQPLSYKVVCAPPNDSDPPVSPIWTADNVAASAPFNANLDLAGVAGETIAANSCVFLSDGSGGNTAGRWYKTDADVALGSTLPPCVGFAATGSTAGNAITVRRSGGLTGTSGLTAGTTYYVSATAGAITSTAPANARRVGVADSTTSLVIAAEIVEPNKGYIPLDLSVGRILSAGATQNTLANGGLSASDSAPIYQRVNGATDKALRLNYAATVVAEVVWSFSYPPDLDDLSAVEVHMLAASGGATNSPVMGVAYFEGVGDSNAGGNTAAITGTTVAEYSVTIAAADVGAHPNFASVSLVPAAHGTDALFLYALWIEYTRKLRST